MDSPIEITPPERQNTMTLEDGRSLAWYEWGPADGIPVIFCTGAAMSGWLGFGTGFLTELGLRLIAPDRPGLGRSAAHPRRTLASWVDDMRAFRTFNRIEEALAVGFSQGAPFAFALAGSGLVSAAAIVSGQDQLNHSRIRSLLQPEVRELLAAAEQDPEAFENSMAESMTADRLWQLVIEMSGKRDLGLYQRPVFAREYRQALEQGFSQGARGYARDLVIALGAWPVVPEDIAIPIDLWYGLEDTSTVHSPDSGRTMASRLRRATRRALPKEGGSILWTKAYGILERLTSHVGSG